MRESVSHPAAHTQTSDNVRLTRQSVMELAQQEVLPAPVDVLLGVDELGVSQDRSQCCSVLEVLE